MDKKTNGTIEEFARELADALQESMEQRYGIHVDPQPRLTFKTNVEKIGLVVNFEDSRIAPNIYAEELYKQHQEGMSVKDIAEKMSDVVFNAHESSPEVPELTAEGARQHITLTLVNTKMNEKLLDTVPHFEILDGELSAIPRWQVSEEASFAVTNDLASAMQLTPDEVLQIGQQHIDNQKFTVQSMQEVLSSLIGDDMADMMPPMESPQMIVLTSDNHIQGANALLSEDALKQVHEKIGNYVVLPSSIHEVICVPADEKLNPKELRAMVHEVNFGQVAPEERLSEEIMLFDGHKLKLVGDSLKMEAPKAEMPKMESQSMKMKM